MAEAFRAACVGDLDTVKSCLEPKTILRLRSLAVRKRATTKNALLARIVRLPNGPCWKVLSYWRATE